MLQCGQRENASHGGVSQLRVSLAERENVPTIKNFATAQQCNRQEQRNRYKFHTGLKQLPQLHSRRRCGTLTSSSFPPPSACLHRIPVSSSSQRRAGVCVGVRCDACGARRTARIRRTGLISRLFTNQHRGDGDHGASRATSGRSCARV